MADGFVLHTSVWVPVSPVHVWRRFLVCKPPPQLAEHTDHSLHWVHDPGSTLHGACCVSSGSPQVWVLRLTVIPPPQVLVQVVHWLQLFHSPAWVLQATVWTSGDAEHGFMRLLEIKVDSFTPRCWGWNEFYYQFYHVWHEIFINPVEENEPIFKAVL